jgi:hypothetical protein
MLQFASARNEIVNSRRAMRDALDNALEGLDGNCCNLVVFHTTMGHKFDELVEEAKVVCPGAEIVGCTAGGIVGKEGASERMRAVAVMAVKGGEFVVGHRDDIRGVSSFDVAADLAAELKEKNPAINMVNIMASGIDIAGDRALAGIASVFGDEVPVFGGTSSDNMRAVVSYQFAGGETLERGIVLIGYADPTLEMVTGVHHGSVPIGKPFEVTRSEGNRVYEIEGKPAWPYLMDKLGLETSTPLAETFPVAGIGQELPAELQEAYDNKHFIHTIFKVDEERMSFYAPADCPVGTKFWLMQRDETLIFEGLDRMVKGVCDRLDGAKPVAVFHTDCLARGRLMFNQVLKEEIVARMQVPICRGDEIPWLGLYGFGEFTPIKGINRFHTQTSSLYAFVRRQG